MRNRKGFTLIELLVVVAIIGLLSTLAVTALGGARKKARDSRRLSDVKQITTALELYYTDQTDYPSGTNITLGGTVTSPYACLSSGGFTPAAALCTANAYMSKVPGDPSYSEASNNKYYRYTRDSATSYTIIYTTEDKSEVGVAGTYRAVPGNIAQ